MIDTKELWQSVTQLAKAGTSGYQSDLEFNNDLNAVQLELLTDLAPHLEGNQNVRDLVYPFLVSGNILTIPDSYYRYVSATINGKQVIPIANNEVDIIKTSPIRSPEASGISYSYSSGSKVSFLTPPGASSGTLTYLRYPAEASIAFSVISSDDSDLVDVTTVVSLEWPKAAYNLLLYKMLLRLGVEMKDSLLQEYGSIGVEIEKQKTK